MAQKLVVSIIGDDRELQRALNRSRAGVTKFGGDVVKPVGQAQAAVKGLAKEEDNLFKVRARRASSVGPLRLAGLGLGAGTALFAATQGVRELSNALEVSGESAFTAGGRMRNFTSSLITGDIVGGLKAVSAMPKTLDEAGISAAEATAKYDTFKKLAADGGGFAPLAKAAVAAADAIRLATAATDALNFSLRETNVLASGLQVAFKPRPEEGRAAQDALAGATKTSGKIFTPIGPEAKNAAKQAISQAEGDTQELLRLQQQELARTTKAFDKARHMSLEERTARFKAMQAAAASVKGTQRQIKETADAAAKVAAAAAKAARKAAAAKLAKHFADIVTALETGVTAAQLTPALNNDLVAMQALKAGLEKQIKAGVNVVENQRKLAAITNAIADTAKERAANQKRIAQEALSRQAFRSIGLGPGGEEFTPTVKNLRKQFAQLSDNPELEDVPKKLLDRFKLIGAALKKSGESLPDDVKKFFNEFFGTVRSEFDKGETGLKLRPAQLSDKLLAALGFTQDVDAKKIQKFTQARDFATPRVTTTAGAPTAGAGGVVISGNITVVADNPDAFLRELQKKAARQTATSRGRFPGRSMGLG